MFSVRFSALRTCVFASLVWLIPQQASALWIVIEVKQIKTGSWSLFGSSFNHYRSQLCFTVGPGDPPPTQTRAVVFDDLTPPEDLALTQLRFYPGPAALEELGGDPLVFDATMFPAPPGYTFDTLGGTEFNIHLDTPRPLLGEPPMHEFPGVFVSSRLPIEDPNLVLAEVYLAGGARVPTSITLVPEPGSMALAATAAVALIGFAVKRRMRATRRSGQGPHAQSPTLDGAAPPT